MVKGRFLHGTKRGVVLLGFWREEDMAPIPLKSVVSVSSEVGKVNVALRWLCPSTLWAFLLCRIS